MEKPPSVGDEIEVKPDEEEELDNGCKYAHWLKATVRDVKPRGVCANAFVEWTHIERVCSLLPQATWWSSFQRI